MIADVGVCFGERDAPRIRVITRVDPLLEMRHVSNLAAQAENAL
jgi:hypothetical protein